MRDNSIMRAGDPIWIVPYDDTWPHQFQQLAMPMRQALGPVALRIDHIGSTSIPQLAAKPVIDMQISVADFEPLDAFRVPLESLGSVFHPENPELTKRYFREAPGQGRIHIHVRRAGSFSEQFALLFRDYLRTHSDIAAQYAELKVKLAQQYYRVEDREAYTEAKGPFIWSVIAQADDWAQQTGWIPGPSDA
ncbi:MAG TPA: GrpB family protein [Ktedonobacteraceae bacterium]|nr:GrpB family protein [Ktedonobacteraceae bacterium]